MRETTIRSGGLTIPLLATAILALAVAVLMLRPALALTGILALCGVTALLVFVRAIPVMFLGSLGVVLIGYALIGRSFAYIGVPPLFVGELVLGLGIVAALASGSLLVIARSPVIWLIAVWAVLGASRTLPYLGEYGIDALRDGVMWGYSAFAVAVAAALVSTRGVPTVARLYNHWIMRAAVWLPMVLLLDRWLGERNPILPGTGQLLFSVKAGDAGVHLAGAAAFVLLGLNSGPPEEEGGDPSRTWRLFWALFVFSLVCVAALNRGGFLAVTAALLVVGFLEPIAVGKRLAIGALVMLMAAGGVALVSENLESEMATKTAERPISPRQVIANVMSVRPGVQTRGNLSDTRQWRIDWWSSIIDYTVHGRYFWTGKGFGVNLADDDGFQVATGDEAPLRSPHSAHMTVLARMGVPGAVVWAALQACFGLSLVLAHRRARAAGAIWWSRVNLWILAYWTAFLVNGSFDVFLEGPQGGIWFWCVLGMGIAVLEVQRRDIPRLQLQRMAS
jgi:O-Antigen ligase